MILEGVVRDWRVQRSVERMETDDTFVMIEWTPRRKRRDETLILQEVAI